MVLREFPLGEEAFGPLIISKNLPGRANFLKCCRGGVWGGEAPTGISVTRALPPEFRTRTNFVRVRGLEGKAFSFHCKTSDRENF